MEIERVEELWATSRQSSLRLVAYDGPGPGGPSVVVLHGLVACVDVLREARPGFDPYGRLGAEGFNVLAVDWPGHGRSGGRRGHLTYRLAMEAAATAVELARERWDGPVALFGTALGGILAFYAALEEPTVQAVACHGMLDLRDVRPIVRRPVQGAVLAAATWLERRAGFDAQQRVPLPASLVAAWSDLARDPHLVRTIRRHPQAVRTYDLAGLGSILLSPENKPDVAAQKVPTFIAIGSSDRLLPESHVRAVAARLSCEQELWVLPGGGHQLLLEHPDALVPAVAAFLRKHVG